MVYENRMIRSEYRSSADVLQEMEQIWRSQQKRQQPQPPAQTRVPAISRPNSWSAVSAQLEIKRKQLQLLAA